MNKFIELKSVNADYVMTRSLRMRANNKLRRENEILYSISIAIIENNTKKTIFISRSMRYRTLNMVIPRL